MIQGDMEPRYTGPDCDEHDLEAAIIVVTHAVTRMNPKAAALILLRIASASKTVVWVTSGELTSDTSQIAEMLVRRIEDLAVTDIWLATTIAGSVCHELDEATSGS